MVSWIVLRRSAAEKFIITGEFEADSIDHAFAVLAEHFQALIDDKKARFEGIVWETKIEPVSEQIDRDFSLTMH